ncbi:type VII secretion target [Yinghuangia seranimata]|uniref:type VII secretion target n=1 Tax=Yinghuangia seranimata TaxID=408067 RepID=UPI00248C6E0D|nr:type VII secretion target [Yinghuangia seranimata]MDI2128192.1 type VII secretion target [Yinghuangia seranimata]
MGEPNIHVNTPVLRESAGNAHAVAEALTYPTDNMASASQEVGGALAGFAIAGALAGIADHWANQIRFISTGYRGAGDNLDGTAKAHEDADARARQLLEDAKPVPSGDGRGWY